MTDDLNRAARSLEPLALEQRRQGPGHPAAEKLVAYQERRLAPAERDKIQGHLAVCSECTQELFELTRLDEAFEEDDLEAADEVPDPGETEASWEALRARLAASPLQTKPLLGAPSRFRRWTASPWTAPALAAALLACLIGFPLWILVHHAPVAARPSIVIQPETFEILRGVEESRAPIAVSLGEAAAVLSLPVPARPSFPAYRVEILSLSGQLRLAVTPALVPMALRQGAQKSSVGDEPGRFVSFGLLRGSLAPGLYRLRIVGLASGHNGETLIEHRIRIVKP